MAGKNKNYCSDLSLSSTATNLRWALNMSRILPTVNASWGGVLSQRKTECSYQKKKEMLSKQEQQMANVPVSDDKNYQNKC